MKDDQGPLYRFFEHWGWVAAGVALALLAAWLLVRWVRRRPPPLPPPSPRTVALRELEKLRSELERTTAYEFSVAVSDVLRSYIGAQYRLRAREQTSPEFLAAIAGSASFSGEEKALLAAFLEKSDLLKFARIGGGREDSEALLASATGFVQGARA